MKPDLGERVAQLLLAVLKSMCYLGLFLGAQVLVMLPSAMVYIIPSMIDGGPAGSEEAFAEALSGQAMKYSLLANLLTLVIILTFYLVRRKKFSEALWLKRVDVPTLWGGAAMAPGMYLIVTGVLMALPESWMESYSDASADITTGGLVGAVAVVVFAPLVEELIFRGLIMTRLSRVMPGWLAALLAAAIFGVCHGHPVWGAYAFVLGALFGFMDLRAGSIWPSILGHLAFNSIDQIRSFLPETGEAYLAYFAVLLVVAVAAPILDRKAIAAMFRRPQTVSIPEPPAEPGVYDFDPWDN